MEEQLDIADREELVKEAIETITSELRCAICLSMVRNPCSLPCSHFFCDLCLDSVFSKLNGVCPNCRTKFHRRQRMKDDTIRNVTKTFRRFHTLTSGMLGLDFLSQGGFSQMSQMQSAQHIPLPSLSTHLSDPLSICLTPSPSATPVEINIDEKVRNSQSPKSRQQDDFKVPDIPRRVLSQTNYKSPSEADKTESEITFTDPSLDDASDITDVIDDVSNIQCMNLDDTRSYDNNFKDKSLEESQHSPPQPGAQPPLSSESTVSDSPKQKAKSSSVAENEKDNQSDEASPANSDNTAKSDNTNENMDEITTTPRRTTRHRIRSRGRRALTPIAVNTVASSTADKSTSIQKVTKKSRRTRSSERVASASASTEPEQKNDAMDVENENDNHNENEIEETSRKRRRTGRRGRSRSTTRRTPLRQASARIKRTPILICHTKLNQEQAGMVRTFCYLVNSQTYGKDFGCLMTVVDSMEDGATHVLTPATRKGNFILQNRTLKYFKGIMLGKWVLSMDWIIESMEAQQILDEREFLVRGDSSGGLNGPLRGHTARMQSGFKFQYNLFENGFVTLHDSVHQQLSQDLSDLLIIGGAKVCDLDELRDNCLQFGDEEQLKNNGVKLRRGDVPSALIPNELKDDQDDIPSTWWAVIVGSGKNQSADARLTKKLKASLPAKVKILTPHWIFDSVGSYRLAPFPV